MRPHSPIGGRTWAWELALLREYYSWSRRS